MTRKWSPTSRLLLKILYHEALTCSFTKSYGISKIMFKKWKKIAKCQQGVVWRVLNFVIFFKNNKQEDLVGSNLQDSFFHSFIILHDLWNFIKPEMTLLRNHILFSYILDWLNICRAILSKMSVILN